jgi:Plasmid pRiA4b ORF-3-like protein
MTAESPKRSRTKTLPTSIHQLKVTLEGIRPPIWRRILVRSDVNLAGLHQIIQSAMGWNDSHLHDFTAGGISYGDRSFGEDMDVEDERKVRLSEIAPQPKDRFRYMYDFGDGWEHIILVEAVKTPEAGARYPVCVTGKRACPPEDCGGVWGYADMLEALADPEHPEHDELKEWIGESFDPEMFDLEQANLRLAGPR